MPPESSQPPQAPQSYQAPQPQMYTVPSSWNKLFILGLIFDFVMPIVGLILGEVLHGQAKSAGNEIWRKKAKWVINIGALVIFICFLAVFALAAIRAQNDTSTSSPTNSSSSESLGEHSSNPSDGQVKLYTTTIETALSTYYRNENPTSERGYTLTWPTLDQLSDASWRKANGVDLSQGDIPASDLATITFVSGTPTKYNQYSYTPLPAGCQNTQASPCIDYILKAKKSSSLEVDDTTKDNIR